MVQIITIRRAVFGAVLFALHVCALSAQSHIAEPTVNLGDTSFLDAIAGPGGVVEEIADGAHDGRIAGANGATTAGSVNSISGLTHVAWISHKRILGAWYGAELIGVAAYVDAGAQGRQGGFGDLTVGPILLQWPQHHLFRMPVDQRVLADFDFPVGYYKRTQGVNLGSNAFTVHPYYSITVHPSKKTETSWRVHYLWNSVNNSPPESSGYNTTQAGQAIHFNATAAYNIAGHLWLGANAYYLTQITDGRVDGVAVAHSPEDVAAIGPGMVYAKGRWMFFVNQYDEFAAKNRATGQKYVFRVTKIF